jgi:hypothetical protein
MPSREQPQPEGRCARSEAFRLGHWQPPTCEHPPVPSASIRPALSGLGIMGWRRRESNPQQGERNPLKATGKTKACANGGCRRALQPVVWLSYRFAAGAAEDVPPAPAAGGPKRRSSREPLLAPVPADLILPVALSLSRSRCYRLMPCSLIGSCCRPIPFRPVSSRSIPRWRGTLGAHAAQVMELHWRPNWERVHKGRSEP